jgi:acid phosphatase family membrane protein YuiD/uncharacterized coiled-coil protein SlyX
MFGGADLGSVYANVDLKTGKLATGIAKSKAMMTGLDRSMVASTSKMGGAQAGLTNLGAKLSNLNGIGGKTTNVIGNLGATLGTLGKVELGAAAFVALAAGLAMCVKAAMEAQKVTAETNAIIKTTGGVANVTTAEIQKLSTAIMMKTGYDDEAVQSGANMMLTFRNVRNEVGKDNDIFNQSIVSMTDLSRKMGIDLPQAAIKIGKALNDPVRGLLNLRRYGIMFTASQEAMIKELAATGDLLGAQKIVLGEIQHEMGGVAEAYGKTLPGKIDIAREAFKNLMETIGKSAIPALTKDLQVLISTFKISDWLKIPAVLGYIVKGFMDIRTAVKLIPGVGAVVQLGQSIWNLGKSLLGLKKPPKITADIDTIGAVKSIKELTGGFERWKSLAAEKKKIDIDTKTASDNLKALDEIVATLDADLKDLTAVSTGVGKKIADELAMKGLAGVTRNDMIAVLHELQAVEPANRKAGYDAMQAFMDAIALSSSEMQEHGTAIMDALKLGIEKAANAGPITAEIIQNLINGLVAQYPELKPVADRLGAILSSGIIAGATPPPGSAAEIAQKWVDVFKGLGGMQPKETKKVSIETTETGSKQTIANLKQVQKWSNTVGSLKPTVKANADVGGAQQRFSDLLNRLQKYNGQVVTTVIIKAAIQGSGPFTADQYARYLEDTIGSATPSVNVNIGIGGGGATDMVGNLQKAWEKMLTTVSGIDLRTWGEQNLQYLNKSFNEASDAIYSVTLSYSGMNEEMSRAAQTNFANLNVQLAGANAHLNEMDQALQASDASIASWQHQIDQNNTSIARFQHANELTGRVIAGLNKEIEASDKIIGGFDKAIEASNKTIGGFDKQIEASNKTIEGFNKSIEESNKRVSEYQAAIDRLSNIKITGQAEADEKSFETIQKINKLKLEILRAEKVYNYELAAKLTLQSEELQKQQEIDSLVASTTYDPQRRQIEAALDPLHGQSETIQNILGGIKSNQSAIATETDMQVGLNSKIEEQRVIQVGINAQIEQQRVIQEGLNAQIEQQRVIQEGVNAKIAEQQALIDANNAQMDILNDQNYELEQTITRERDRVYDLRLEYDECVKNVKNLETAINEMGANAVARWNEITAAIDRANSAAGGSAASYQRGGPVGPGGGTVEPGEFVLSKPMLKAMGGMPRMSPVNVNYSGGDTVVHSHTYLNGREIAHDVSREIGRNASAYSRSGGRY